MEKNYSASITTEQFLFHEMRLTASLQKQGLSHEDIFAKVKEENLFQLPTEKSIRKITRACLKRLDVLNSEKLVSLLASAPAKAAKQVNLYAMMRQNGIVWDFMLSVIGEKFRMQDLSFSRKDMNLFFFALQEQIPSVEQWSDTTLVKVKQVLVKSIQECDYLDSVRSDKLNPVYLYPEVKEEILSAGASEVLPAFNCFY